MASCRLCVPARDWLHWAFCWRRSSSWPWSWPTRPARPRTAPIVQECGGAALAGSPPALAALHPGQPAAGRRAQGVPGPPERAPGLPGGGQQVGLVVRSVPDRVPRLPAGVGQVRPPGGVRRRRRQGRQRSAAAFLRRFPVSYPSYTDPNESIARAIEAATYYPQTVYFNRQRQDGVRPRRPLRERRGPRAGHPALRAAMTDTITYEVRRVRGEEEMAAVLELRHEVFCEEQGVPEREELDGRDREGMHLVAVSGGRCWPPAGCCSSGRRCSSAGWRCASARRQGIASALLALADEESRAGGARRLVLHAQTYARSLYEARRLRAAGADLHGGGDRAHRDGEVPLSGVPELRIDPLTGQRAIIAGERAGRPGGGSGRAGAERRRATRSPTATRTARRPSCMRCGPAAAPRTPPAGGSAWCRTCTRRSSRTPRIRRRSANRDLFWCGPAPGARTR